MGARGHLLKDAPFEELLACIREIAGCLFVGETTVKSHLRSVFAKLDVLSRTEAVAVATRQGLIKMG